MLELLKQEDRKALTRGWMTQRALVFVLGELGYEPAVEALMVRLDHGKDWRMELLAARALGQLKAQQALPLLQRMSEEHWHPGVRFHAKRAILIISGQADYAYRNATERITERNGLFERYLYNWPPWGGLIPRTDSEWHEFLENYQEPPRPPLQRSPGEFTKLERYLAFYWDDFEETYWVPDSGLYFHRGLLLGVDRGEFGGRLVY
jgi:hypothetical protein